MQMSWPMRHALALCGTAMWSRRQLSELLLQHVQTSTLSVFREKTASEMYRILAVEGNSPLFVSTSLLLYHRHIPKRSDSQGMNTHEYSLSVWHNSNPF
jgi:hypothetical protein